jgi:ABC-type molybdate transport system substrate-binding protein
MLTKGEMKPEVKAYLDYVKSPAGQEIIKTEKFIPVAK